MLKLNKKQPAFTIVELLVVIVVIAILAAITIVSYTGISNRATVSAIQSDLSNNSNLLKMYYTDYGYYPTTISTDCVTYPDTTTNKCLKLSNGNTPTYTSTPNSDYKFKLVITNTSSSTSYYITGNSSPAVGGKNLLSDEDASFEGNTKGNWLGGNATLSVVTTDAYHGTHSLKMVATHSVDIRIYQSLVALFVGDEAYTVSFRAKANNADAVGKQFAAGLWGNSTSWTWGNTITLTTSWQTSTITKTWATGDTSRNMYLYSGGTHVIGEEVLVDAIQLELGSTATF